MSMNSALSVPIGAVNNDNLLVQQPESKNPSNVNLNGRAVNFATSKDSEEKIKLLVESLKEANLASKFIPSKDDSNKSTFFKELLEKALNGFGNNKSRLYNPLSIGSGSAGGGLDPNLFNLKLPEIKIGSGVAGGVLDGIMENSLSPSYWKMGLIVVGVVATVALSIFAARKYLAA